VTDISRTGVIVTMLPQMGLLRHQCITAEIAQEGMREIDIFMATYPLQRTLKSRNQEINDATQARLGSSKHEDMRSNMKG
jgi:hypothetical protein